MLTICPYCTQDTGGNHEIKCPNYKQTSIIPNDSDITMPTITINPTVTITFPISNDVIEFLEGIISENCDCGHTNNVFCLGCQANNLLTRIKGT